METIDVRGLPEPIAKMILAMVESLRQQNNGHKPTTPPPPLPIKRGTVIGPLTREQIYNDAV